MSIKEALQVIEDVTKHPSLKLSFHEHVVAQQAVETLKEETKEKAPDNVVALEQK